MKNFLLESKYLNEDARLLNPYNLEAEPTEGDHAIVTGYVFQDSKGVDEAQRRVSGLTSTQTIDRYEEIIEAAAFTPWLKTFMENPQFLASHRMAGFDSAAPTSLGHWVDLSVERGIGLRGTAQFLEPGDELADKYWTRYRQRALRAFSVGVIVHEWAMREFELADGVNKRIRVLTNVELLEISAVSVPANRQALIRAAGLATRQPEKAADSFDVKALADLLWKNLAGRITDHHTNLIKELNAEPGTPLYHALERIAESWHLLQGCGHEHEGDAQLKDGKKQEKTTGHPALNYLLGSR